jgi:hypothetical protein
MISVPRSHEIRIVEPATGAVLPPRDDGVSFFATSTKLDSWKLLPLVGVIQQVVGHVRCIEQPGGAHVDERFGGFQRSRIVGVFPRVCHPSMV